MEEPIDRAVRILNEALAADPKAIQRLMDSSVPVNDKLANHPSIQVAERPDASGYRLRLMGLINGLFGTRDDSYGHICAVVERRLDGSFGDTIRFDRTPLPEG